MQFSFSLLLDKQPGIHSFRGEVMWEGLEQQAPPPLDSRVSMSEPDLWDFQSFQRHTFPPHHALPLLSTTHRIFDPDNTLHSSPIPPFELQPASLMLAVPATKPLVPSSPRRLDVYVLKNCSHRSAEIFPSSEDNTHLLIIAHQQPESYISQHALSALVPLIFTSWCSLTRGAFTPELLRRESSAHQHHWRGNVDWLPNSVQQRDPYLRRSS